MQTSYDAKKNFYHSCSTKEFCCNFPHFVINPFFLQLQIKKLRGENIEKKTRQKITQTSFLKNRKSRHKFIQLAKNGCVNCEKEIQAVLFIGNKVKS